MKVKEYLQLIKQRSPIITKKQSQILKLIIVAGFFVALLLIIDFRELLDTLLSIDVWLFLAGFLLIIPVELLNTYQQYSLMRLQGIRIDYFSLIKINLSIKFYLLFLPGAFVGSGMRWYRVSQPEGKRAETLAAIAFNRVFEIFLIVIFGISFYLVSGDQDNENLLPGLLVLATGISLLWLILTRLSRVMYTWIKKATAGRTLSSLAGFFYHSVVKLLEAAGNYQDIAFGRLFLLISLGLIRLLIGLLSFYLIALSVEIHIPFADMGWIRSVMMITLILPLSIAGGLGIREASLIVLLSTFGVPAESSLAFSILIYLRQVILGIVGGAVEGGSTLFAKRGDILK